MSEMETIAAVSVVVGVTLAGLCIWLLVRAINGRDVLWIAFTALPFVLMAAGVGFLFVATFAGINGWLP
jgi:hypothetical protein